MTKEGYNEFYSGRSTCPKCSFEKYYYKKKMRDFSKGLSSFMGDARFICPYCKHRYTARVKMYHVLEENNSLHKPFVVLFYH